MPNLAPIDDRIVSALRDMPLSPAPSNLVARMIEARAPQRTAQWKWLGAVAVAGSGLAVVAVLSLQPSVTFAQVIAAKAGVTGCTAIESRIDEEGTRGRTVVSQGSHAWAQVTYNMAGHERGRFVVNGELRTEITTFPDGHVEVQLDDGQPLPPLDVTDLKLSEQHMGAARRIRWHGRDVDEFTRKHEANEGTAIAGSVYRVLADPTTHLPLYLEYLFDNGRWGESWEYTYGEPPVSAFSTAVPTGAKVYDRRQERADLMKLLREGPVLLVGARMKIQVLMPEGLAAKSKPVSVGSLLQPFIRSGDQYQVGDVIANGYYSSRNFPPTANMAVNKLRRAKTTTLQTGGRLFKAVPVMDVGDVYRLTLTLHRTAAKGRR